MQGDFRRQLFQSYLVLGLKTTQTWLLSYFSCSITLCTKTTECISSGKQQLRIMHYIKGLHVRVLLLSSDCSWKHITYINDM